MGHALVDVRVSYWDSLSHIARQRDNLGCTITIDPRKNVHVVTKPSYMIMAANQLLHRCQKAYFTGLGYMRGV